MVWGWGSSCTTRHLEGEITSRYFHLSNKPIYLLGTSFGGCIALAVAARNPCIDLVLVLVNPGISPNKSAVA
jgi:pimeloyl-ACP methyl ester carboxylesterase